MLNLTVLGQLGVMHITPLQAAKHESIERVDARIKQLEKAISVLNRYDNEQLLVLKSEPEPTIRN